MSYSRENADDIQRATYIACHASRIIELPDPRGAHPEFTRSDPRIPEWLADKLREFRFKNIVHVEQHRDEWIYQADESAYLEALDQANSSENTLPCGHAGSSNLADADGYECSTCRRTYSRATLEAAFSER